MGRIEAYHCKQTSLAYSAALGFMVKECRVAMDRYDVCTVRFPKAAEYQSMFPAELERIAFHPVISDLFTSLEVRVKALPDREYERVTSARLQLYCSELVKVLTSGLFNFQSYDTIAHAYFKQYQHLSLTATCFSFAATVVSHQISNVLMRVLHLTSFLFQVIFCLHEIRTGCSAQQTLPIQDPDFCMQTATGELSPRFFKIWRITSSSLNAISLFPATPGINILVLPRPAAGPSSSGGGEDQSNPDTDSERENASTNSPRPAAHSLSARSPASVVASSPRSVGNSSGIQLMSLAVKKKLSGYLRGDKPASPTAGTTQVGPGSPATLMVPGSPHSPGQLATASGSPTPDAQIPLPSLKLALSEFCQRCQLDVERWEDRDLANFRYPFIQMTIEARRQAVRIRLASQVTAGSGRQ